MADSHKKISKFPHYSLSDYISEGVNLLGNVNITTSEPSTGIFNSNEMISTYLGYGIDPQEYYPSLEAYISSHSGGGGGGFDPTDLPTWSVSAVTYLAIATDEELGGLGKVPIESYIAHNMYYRYIPSIYYNMRDTDYRITSEDLSDNTTFVINDYNYPSGDYRPYTLDLGTLMCYIREHL